MSCHCELRYNDSLISNTIVCSKHKSVVCGVCCSDYYLFNKLIKDRNMDTMTKEIEKYFKNPKKISRFSSKRLQSLEIHSLLNSIQTMSKKQQILNIIEVITLCGFLCFTGRFDQNTRRLIPVHLELAMESYIITSIIQNGKKNTITYLKRIHKKETKCMQKRREEREQKLKEEQVKKQQQFKKNGIRRRIKNRKSTFNEKMKNGEIDIFHTSQADNIFILLTNSGCIEFGSFFVDIYDDCIALNKLIKDEKHEEGKEKWLQFLLKYSPPIPAGDPSTWSDTTFDEYLMSYNITPKPKPPRAVLLKVVTELIDITMQNMMVSIDDLERDEILENSTNIVIDAQQSISENTNPFILKDWSKDSSITEPFQSVPKHSVTTKPFHDICQLFLSMVITHDHHGASKSPMFILQDKSQRQALAIYIIGVKQHLSTLPMIVIKYLNGKRGNVNAMHGMMHGFDPGHEIAPVQTDPKVVKLMTRLFQKNRSKLLGKIVRKTENQFVKGWKLSAFIPYENGEKKCPSCHQLASLRCSRCKIVAYCSVSCQKRDWKNHKKICKK